MARRCATQSGGCTGREPRQRRNGMATWMARSRRANAPRVRSWRRWGDLLRRAKRRKEGRDKMATKEELREALDDYVGRGQANERVRRTMKDWDCLMHIQAT